MPKGRSLNLVDDMMRAIVPVTQGLDVLKSLKRYGIKHTFYRTIGKMGGIPLSMMPKWIEDAEKSDVVKREPRVKSFQKTTRSHDENPSAFHHFRASHFASEAYKLPNERSKHMFGYHLSDRESDQSMAVYRNSTGGVQIALRGTDPTSIRDLSADVNIAMGLSSESDHYQNTRNKVERILDRHNRIYSRENKHAHVDINGHSLSGREIHDMFKEPHIADSIRAGYAFAPGGSPIESDNPRETKELSSRQIKHLHSHLSHGTDILSRHNTEGTYMQGKIYQHNYGHSHWSDTNNLDYWDQFDDVGSIMDPIEEVKDELRR